MTSKVRFGLIGAGLWGEKHAEIYSSHYCSELLAVCDQDPERARVIAERYGAARWCTHHSEIVSDSEVDAVAIVTPDFAHTPAILAAAEKGKPMIVEKPLATSREDLCSIRAALDGTKLRVMVDFHCRWNPAIAAAKKTIEEGRLGEIKSAYFRLNDKILVPTEMLTWAARSSILWFLGSHAVDTLRYLVEDEVVRVYSVSRSGVLSSRGVDVPDLYQSILEFSRGAVATIENSWIVPNTTPNINDIKLNLTGSRGMINLDLSNNQLMERYLEDGSDHPDCLVMPYVLGKYRGFAHESIRDFVEAVGLDKPIHADWLDGIRVSSVILALLESAERGLRVDVRYE